MSYRILVINPGSTSTKIGVFEDEVQLFSKTLRHSAEKIAEFAAIADQTRGVGIHQKHGRRNARTRGNAEDARDLRHLLKEQKRRARSQACRRTDVELLRLARAS